MAIRGAGLVLAAALAAVAAAAAGAGALPYRVDRSARRARPRVTRPETVSKIYQLAFDTTRLLAAGNVTHLASDGTLLGAVRHGGLIPWDNDVDLLVPQGQMDRLRALRPAFRAMGYDLRPFMLGTKVLYAPPAPFPFLDVVPYRFDRRNRTYDVKNHVFDYCHMRREEMFPLRRYRFGEFEVPGPREHAAYLDRCYRALGGDWRTVAMEESGDHRSYRALAARSAFPPARAAWPVRRGRFNYTALARAVLHGTPGDPAEDFG